MRPLQSQPFFQGPGVIISEREGPHLDLCPCGPQRRMRRTIFPCLLEYLPCALIIPRPPLQQRPRLHQQIEFELNWEFELKSNSNSLTGSPPFTGSPPSFLGAHTAFNVFHCTLVELILLTGNATGVTHNSWHLHRSLNAPLASRQWADMLMIEHANNCVNKAADVPLSRFDPHKTRQ